MIDEDKLKIIKKREREKDLENLTEECRRLLQIGASHYMKTDRYGNAYCSIIPCEGDNDLGYLCPYASDEQIVSDDSKNDIKHVCLYRQSNGRTP